jgi:MOSC domain-containing protein YiiM
MSSGGRVTHLFIAPQRGAPMMRKRAVEAVADTGLAGDRYLDVRHRGGPDNQVTLIELENIHEFTAMTGLVLTPDMPRRNVVTEGVRLNDLCGKRFAVGAAVFEGIELCEPCRVFARRTHREVLPFFKARGGLRARIVSGGRIQVGDRVGEPSPSPGATQ